MCFEQPKISQTSNQNNDISMSAAAYAATVFYHQGAAAVEDWNRKL